MNKIIFVLFVLASCFPCLADEPNNPKIADYNTIEARLIALEERISAIEERISQLESRRPAPVPRNPISAPAQQDDPNKDALRIDRAKKQIQELKDDIKLTEAKILALPGWPYNSLKDHLDTLTKHWELLEDIEDNYSKILRLAQKSPELGMDIITLQKNIIKCQGRQKEVETEKESLKEQMRAPQGEIGQQNQETRLEQNQETRTRRRPRN